MTLFGQSVLRLIFNRNVLSKMAFTNAPFLLVLMLAAYLHPGLCILLFLNVYTDFPDDRSCDSDDSLGTGSRGRSSSQRSQGNKLQNDEESLEGNFEAERNKGPIDHDAQDDVIIV